MQKLKTRINPLSALKNCGQFRRIFIYNNDGLKSGSFYTFLFSI